MVRCRRIFLLSSANRALARLVGLDSVITPAKAIVTLGKGRRGTRISPTEGLNRGHGNSRGTGRSSEYLSVRNTCCKMLDLLTCSVLISLGFLASSTPVVAENAGCRSLDGKWYNQLGSEMILNHTTSGELYGIYKTAVERHSGAAGYSHSRVVGASPYNKPGATVGFAVMFNSGTSTTSWTGQCLVCDGEEILVSSWLLREQVNTCIDKWKSTRIGQDMFTRTEQLTDTEEEDSSSGYSISNSIKPVPHTMAKRAVGAEIHCVLEGAWYNELGSEVMLHHQPDNVITGEYRTAVERSSGTAGSNHSLVYGLGNVYNGDTTFALFVVWNGGVSVTGWVGQCHLCGEDHQEILQVNWLLRSQINDCDDNWKATLYGQNSFTRHEQKKGPRKRLGIHTPQQEGEAVILELREDIVQLPCSASLCTSERLSVILLAFLAASCQLFS